MPVLVDTVVAARSPGAPETPTGAGYQFAKFVDMFGKSRHDRTQLDSVVRQQGGYMQVRRATADDAGTLAALLAGYLRESYPDHIGSSPEQLRRDVLGGRSRHHVLLAETKDIAIGFVAWDLVYDMHWAASGAQIADLFVIPSYRGLGVSLALVASAAADVQANGGVFLRGGAYDRETTRRMYARVAVVHPSGDTYLSARAFRRLAELASRPIRDIIRGLPPVEWNFSN